jgi:hypothetical protein
LIGFLPLVPTILIWTAFVCSAFYTLYWVARRISNAALVWKYILFGSLGFLGAIGPLEAASGWTLDLPLLVPYGLSLFACLAMFALWARKKATPIPGWRLGLLVGVCTAAVAPFLILWLISQNDLLQDTVSSGRVSPTLTYRITSSQAWGGGRNYSYIFYRNAQSIVWLHRVVSTGRMPCTSDDPVFGLWIVRATPDDHTVSVSCEFGPLQGKSARTTEISVP